MNITPDIVFNILLSLISTGILFWVNSIRSGMQKNEDAIKALNDLVLGTYVKQSDYKEGIKEIKELLTIISQKLDAKMDRIYPNEKLICPTH